MLPDNTITARMPRAKPKENAQKEEVQKHKALGPHDTMKAELDKILMQ
jgi:hypothetical protein